MGTLAIPTWSEDHKSPGPALTLFSSLNAGISTTCSSVSFICKMETLIPPYLPHSFLEAQMKYGCESALETKKCIY